MPRSGVTRKPASWMRMPVKPLPSTAPDARASCEAFYGFRLRSSSYGGQVAFEPALCALTCRGEVTTQAHDATRTSALLNTEQSC
jgi:hypothetical protein